MKIILVISLISAIFSNVDFDLEEVRKDLLDRHNYYRENQHLALAAVGGTGIRVVVKPPNDVLEGLAYAPIQLPPPKPELPTSPSPLLPKSPGFIYAPDQPTLEESGSSSSDPISIPISPDQIPFPSQNSPGFAKKKK